MSWIKCFVFIYWYPFSIFSCICTSMCCMKPQCNKSLTINIQTKLHILYLLNILLCIVLDVIKLFNNLIIQQKTITAYSNYFLPDKGVTNLLVTFSWSAFSEEYDSFFLVRFKHVHIYTCIIQQSCLVQKRYSSWFLQFLKHIAVKLYSLFNTICLALSVIILTWKGLF